MKLTLTLDQVTQLVTSLIKTDLGEDGHAVYLLDDLTTGKHISLHVIKEAPPLEDE